MYCNHFASCGMCGPSLYSKTKETGNENNPPCLAKLVALLLLQPCCECCSSDVSTFHLFSKEKYLFYFDDQLQNCSEMQRINFYHITDGKSNWLRGFGLRAWIEKKLMIKSYRIAESRQIFQRFFFIGMFSAKEKNPPWNRERRYGTSSDPVNITLPFSFQSRPGSLIVAVSPFSTQHLWIAVQSKQFLQLLIAEFPFYVSLAYYLQLRSC